GRAAAAPGVRPAGDRQRHARGLAARREYRADQRRVRPALAAGGQCRAHPLPRGDLLGPARHRVRRPGPFHRRAHLAYPAEDRRRPGAPAPDQDGAQQGLPVRRRGGQRPAMNTIFLRIYGGIIAALMLVGLLGVGALQLSNEVRSDQYREQLARGTFRLMADSLQPMAEIDRRRALVTWSRLLGVPLDRK